MDINGGRLSFDAWIRDSDFQRQINAMEQRITGLSNRAVSEASRMDRAFAKLSATLSGYFTIQGVSQFINDVIRVRSEFQQLEISFTTMLRSKMDAEVLMKELVEFAGTTPFGLKDTANAAKQLLAYGSTAKTVTAELRMLGDVAAGTSQPIGELVYLYGTARTQGRAYLNDIRQFAGRGIPIYQELAKVLGTTVSQVNDFVSAGKVGFDEIQQAFRNMTAAGSMFGGLMEAQSKTFQGQIERVKDAWDEVLNTIGKNNEEIISTTIEGIGTVIENYDKLLEILSGLVVVYGSYRAALIATAALKQLDAARTVGMTAAEILHYNAIVIKTAAMRTLNAVMAASPVIAMTAAIAGLVAIIYSLTQVTNATAAARERLNDAIEAGGKSADNERRSVDSLIAVMRSHTASAEQKKAAYDKLIAQTGDILSSYSQEEIATGKATAKLDEYIAKIREAASARKAFDEFNSLAEQMDDINRSGIDAIGTWTKFGRAMKNTFTPTSQGVGFSEWIDVLFKPGSMSELIVGQEKTVLEQSMDELRKAWGDKWEEIITGVKKEDPSLPVVTITQRLKELNQEIATTESSLKAALSPDAVFDKANIDKLQGSLKALKEERDQLMGKTKEGDKANKELERWGEKRIDILQKIADREAEIRAKGMTESEREIEEARIRYAEMRRVIEEHNEKAPASQRISSGVLEVLNNLERRETGDILYRQETERLQQHLDEQLALYRQFHSSKLELGENAARQLFANEESFVEDFRSVLTGQINALQGMDMEIGLTGVQKERLKELWDLLLEFDKDERARARERTQYLLTTYQNYEQKREALVAKYNKDIAELEAKGEKDRAKQAKRERDNAILELYQSQLEATDEYQEMLRTLNMAGSDAAVGALKNGQEFVNNWIKTISDPTVRQKIQDLMDDWFAQSKDSAEQGNWSNLASLVDGFEQLVANAIQFDGTMSGTFKTIGAMVRQVGQLAQTLGQTFQDIGGNLSKGGGIASIVGAVFSLFGSISEAIEGSYKKRAQKEQEAANFQMKQMDAVTKALEYQLRIIQDIYGVDRVKAYSRAVADTTSSLNKSISELPTGPIALQSGNKGNDQLLNLFNKDFGSLDALEKEIERVSKKANNFWNKVNPFGNDWKIQERLLKDLRDRVVNADSYKFEWESIEDITQEEISKLEDMLNRGAFDEITANKVRNIIDQYDLWKNAINELRAELTGTTFSGVTDEIVAMFERGTIAAEDFADNFEKIMQRAILQSLKRNVLEKEMQGWYESFSDAVESDNKDGSKGLNSDEVSELQKKYNEILERAKVEFESLKAVAGVDFTSGNTSERGLPGSIRREMTEQTASELVGLYRSTYDLNKQQLNAVGQTNNYMNTQVSLMRDKLALLTQIQTNTLHTANNTARLENIESGISQIARNTRQGSNLHERP